MPTFDTRERASAAQAFDRVLAAEHQAAARLKQAEQDRQQQLERARQDALATVNRSLERIKAWQQAHAAALQLRLDAPRLRAGAPDAAPDGPDAAAVAQAVEQLACRLTGGAGDTPDAPC
jgi:hypothetical protein